MIYIFWIVIIFFTIIIQGSISLFDVTPNFTAVLAYYLGVKRGEINGMFLGSFIGILEDSLSCTFLGPNLLSKGMIGYLSSLISSKLFIWTPVLGIISIFVLTITDSFIVFMSRSVFHIMPVSISAALFIFLIQSLLNAPLGIFIKPNEK
jgi:rod shape-determining protein MreD